MKSNSGAPHQWLTTHFGESGPVATVSQNEHCRATVAGRKTYLVTS